MSLYVEHLEATGIYGLFDISQSFRPGVNVLFARNGKGKTTLLHIIANLLNEDYKRFAFIDFDSITMRTSDGNTVKLRKENEEYKRVIKIWQNDKELEPISISAEGIVEIPALLKQHILSQIKDEIGDKVSPSVMIKIAEEIGGDDDSYVKKNAAYFPSFRTMIEAWASSTEEESLPSRRALVKSRKIQQRKTKFARKLFGDFVPWLNYPSTVEIEASLNEEINESFFKVKQAEQKYLGGILPQIFNALSKDSQPVEGDSDLVIEEIKSLTENLKNYPDRGLQIVDNLEASVKLFEAEQDSKKAAVRVLNTYKDALEKVVGEQQKSFAVIEKYLKAVNSFLEDKQIEVLWENLPKPSSRRNALGIKFNDGLATIIGIGKALSSGERQIITLIYAASRMSKNQIVLVDEPEISLHVDWQSLLLNQMSRQLGERQIIICTHSPVIGADYEDEVIMLEPTITENPNPRNSQDEVELAW